MRKTWCSGDTRQNMATKLHNYNGATHKNLQDRQNLKPSMRKTWCWDTKFKIQQTKNIEHGNTMT